MLDHRRVGRRRKSYRPRLLRRFLRHRLAEPTGFSERRMQDWLEVHWGTGHDYEYEDFCNWHYWHDYYEDVNPALVAKHFEIRQFLRSKRWGAGKGLLDSLQTCHSPRETKRLAEPWLPIEERLMLHVEALFHRPEDSQTLRDAFDGSPFSVQEVDNIDC